MGLHRVICSGLFSCDGFWVLNSGGFWIMGSGLWVLGSLSSPHPSGTISDEDQGIRFRKQR